MRLDDFERNANAITTEGELISRLQTVRRGEYGAFFLYHEELFPMLSIQFNGDLAYLHYFPSEDHPGYQPCRMTPDDCESDVHFIQLDGDEANSFDMPRETLVSVEAAYAAATAFLHKTALPASVSWLEL